jgi:hypothetical protein
MESKHAHIMHMVSQLTYPTDYEKGCKCLLTSHIQVNPPTKLFPVITDTKHHHSRVKAKPERTRMKLKNRCPAF